MGIVNVVSFSKIPQSTSKLEAFSSSSDLEMKLQNVEGEQALKDINLRESITRLTKERDKLLHLSMERGEVIQVNVHTEIKALLERANSFTYTQIPLKYRRNKRKFSNWRKDGKKRKKPVPKQKTGKLLLNNRLLLLKNV